MEEWLTRISALSVEAAAMTWLWALGGFLIGILSAHLLWWRRKTKLAELKKEIMESQGRIERRRKENERELAQIATREETFRMLEATLKSQTDQLKPQIEEIRNWVDQVARREEELALREADLDRKVSAKEVRPG